MFDFHTATTWDRETILAWFMYRVDQETRAKLMSELPGAYNRISGREIVQVIRASDGLKVD